MPSIADALLEKTEGALQSSETYHGRSEWPPFASGKRPQYLCVCISVLTEADRLLSAGGCLSVTENASVTNQII